MLIRDTRNTIYPKEILREAIWTLELLFPIGDKDTEDLLTKRKGLSRGGEQLLNSTFWQFAPPGFHRYQYWKARLVELHDEYHAPPQTLWAALKDGRNVIVWWTFWLAFAIAVQTFIFGVVTCVLMQDALDKSKG